MTSGKIGKQIHGKLTFEPLNFKFQTTMTKTTTTTTRVR